MNKIHSILLVDDDPVANFIHQDLLSNLEISDEIQIASNGAEALKMVKESCPNNNCPELILLDLNMPVMDGFQFLEGYNKWHMNKDHEVKIVVLSSSSNPKDIEKAKSLEATDYLVKPLTESKVKEWIEEHFKKAK